MHECHDFDHIFILIIVSYPNVCHIVCLCLVDLGCVRVCECDSAISWANIHPFSIPDTTVSISEMERAIILKLQKHRWGIQVQVTESYDSDANYQIFSYADSGKGAWRLDYNFRATRQSVSRVRDDRWSMTSYQVMGIFRCGRSYVSALRWYRPMIRIYSSAHTWWTYSCVDMMSSPQKRPMRTHKFRSNYGYEIAFYI